VAFVDLARERLVLKAVVAGPPAVGKTSRLLQVARVGRSETYGRTALGPQRMAVLPVEAEREGRAVEVELYEWHGLERADVRGKGIFVGLDGLVYIADARADRKVDSERQLEFLIDSVGRSRMRRLPGLLMLGQHDEGLLRLAAYEGTLTGVQWSHRYEGTIDDESGFLEALRLYGEVMLTRTV
jgi:hypothetical protein